MITEYMAACPYCGQMVAVTGDEVRLLDAIGYVKVKRTHKKQLEM